MRIFFSFLVTFIFNALFSCHSPPKGEIADLIYHNGNIITMEEDLPNGSSVAVKEGKIIAVSEQSLQNIHQGENTQVIDLKGKTLLPGFVDAHSHIAAALAFVRQANLSSPPVSTNVSFG